MFVLNSRRNDLVKTVKSMPTSAIKPIFIKKTGYSGGIEELGNFKEGFCFKINSLQGGEELSWIMCTL